MLDVLQLSALHAEAEASLPPLPPPGADGFAAAVDAAMAELRARRDGLARARGGLDRLRAGLDRRLRTDRPERMDDPALPEDERVAMVRGLHLQNRVLGTYDRFERVLAPLAREVALRAGRPARVLELASGSGAFALHLARRARRTGLPVEVTGSDLVPAYVEQARAEAARRAIPAEFRVLDATRLDGLAPGAFDLVFLGQAAHHFSAGTLASVVAAAARVSTTAMVVVDGRRTPALFPLLALTTTLQPRLRHDSFVSARKFYSEPELAFVGRSGAPGAAVRAWPSHPGYSVLVVRFDPGARTGAVASGERRR